MYAYKGFEPDLSCRGYRFVMGKNVTPEANCASNGFHCAEDPLDCLSYYGDMNRSIYCLVQPGGDIDEDDRDSKIACTELTILRQLTRKEFFLHALAYMVDHPGRKVSDKVQREHSTSRNGYAIVRGKTPAACGKLGDSLRHRDPGSVDSVPCSYPRTRNQSKVVFHHIAQIFHRDLILL